PASRQEALGGRPRVCDAAVPHLFVGSLVPRPRCVSAYPDCRARPDAELGVDQCTKGPSSTATSITTGRRPKCSSITCRPDGANTRPAPKVTTWEGVVGTFCL